MSTETASPTFLFCDAGEMVMVAASALTAKHTAANTARAQTRLPKRIIVIYRLQNE
jgi:hypothetical protein